MTTVLTCSFVDAAWKMSVFGVFLVCIFPHLDGANTEWYKISLLFSPYAGKYGPEKQRIGTFFTPCFVWCWTTEHLSPSMRHYKKSRVLATITKLSDYINCCDYYFRKFWLLNFAVFLEDRNAGKKVAVLTNGWWR